MVLVHPWHVSFELIRVHLRLTVFFRINNGSDSGRLQAKLRLEQVTGVREAQARPLRWQQGPRQAESGSQSLSALEVEPRWQSRGRVQDAQPGGGVIAGEGDFHGWLAAARADGLAGSAVNFAAGGGDAR